MAHRLNTNKQFMVGNGILAFAVIFVVVLFIYLAMRLQRERQQERVYVESYYINLERGFLGDSISVYLNDSLLMNRVIREEPVNLQVGQFADRNALLIVDNLTDYISTFNLSDNGDIITLVKDDEGIKQLAK